MLRKLPWKSSLLGIWKVLGFRDSRLYGRFIKAFGECAMACRGRLYFLPCSFNMSILRNQKQIKIKGKGFE